jgi:hypothetical protein
MNAEGAEIVHGSVRESLYDVVTGKVTSSSIVEDRSRTALSLTLKMDGAEDASIVVLQTGHGEGTICHSIVFMRDSTGQWKTGHWQTSK